MTPVPVTNRILASMTIGSRLPALVLLVLARDFIRPATRALISPRCTAMRDNEPVVALLDLHALQLSKSALHPILLSSRDAHACRFVAPLGDCGSHFGDDGLCIRGAKAIAGRRS